MNTASLCNPYIWENPLIIFQTQFFYSTNMTCLSELVNQIIIVFVISALAVYLLWRSTKMYLPLVAVGLFTTLVIYPSVNSIMKLRKQYEPFSPDVVGQNTFAPRTGYDTTMPTSRNPFMNILVDEIKYNPTRPKAASVMASTNHTFHILHYRMQYLQCRTAPIHIVMRAMLYTSIRKFHSIITRGIVKSYYQLDISFMEVGNVVGRG